MEFILELKNNIMGGKTEKFVSIVLAIILACGALMSGYKYAERYAKFTVPKNEVINLEEKMEAMPVPLKIEVAESKPVEKVDTMVLESETEEMEVLIEEVEVTEEEKIETNTADITVNDAVENEAILESSTEIEDSVIVDNISGVEEGEILDNTVEVENGVITGNMTNIENGAIADNMAEIEDGIEPAVLPAEITSPFLIDDFGVIYGFLPEYADLSSGTLELPSKGCMGIRRGTFAGCTEYIAEICIPAGIHEIEDGALTELTSLEWITVDAGNPNYMTVDGILFDSTDTQLVAYPPARVGAYSIPAGVVSIAENAFKNTSLFIIDLRECGLSENCLLNISESCSIIE